MGEKNPGRARLGSCVAWGRMRCLGRACDLGRANPGHHAQPGRSRGRRTRLRSSATAWVILSLFLVFFFFFLPSLGSSLICSGLFFNIYKGWKLSLRDLISMWSPRGKICHIGPHQTIKIEFLRLEMLVNNIVLKPTY